MGDLWDILVGEYQKGLIEFGLSGDLGEGFRKSALALGNPTEICLLPGNRDRSDWISL